MVMEPSWFSDGELSGWFTTNVSFNKAPISVPQSSGYQIHLAKITAAISQ